MSKKYILFLIILLCSLNCSAGSNVEHIFDLAKKSVCKDVAEDILKNPLFTPAGKPTGKAAYFISQLNLLTASPFPYRFEITNGYKEGFVYYALLGYVNEMNGDIPIAYRYYQNSLACIDEEKSFDYPLPRAEIYLAIGRTCLASGRYMDAKDWLDTSFLEAGDNLQLQAAIDRVLIQRANELGDYPEVIFLYQHLLSLANDNNSPPLKGETGGCKLTKEDYANYAQILFYSRKDREGFSKLLAGISKLGIDNNLGVKDPLVDKFLNNIMRAEDDEVKWFYDLLGWAIVDARAKAGDEEYLAFLCNARTLFCKVYDFLNRKDDLKKVKERIDVVKEKIANGKNPFGEKYSVSGIRYLRSTRRMPSGNLKIDKSGNVEKTPEIVLEDLLMLADWRLKQRDYKSSGTNYYLASLIATGTFANIEYDGTTMGNAAIMGITECNLIINPKHTFITLTDQKIVNDGSLRFLLKINYNVGSDECLDENKFKNLQFVNYQILLYKLNKCPQDTKKIDAIYEKFISKYTHFRGYNYMNWIKKLIKSGDYEKAFNVALRCLLYDCKTFNRMPSLLEFCLSYYPDSNSKDLDLFKKQILRFLIPYILSDYASARLNYRKALIWEKNFYPQELKFREMIKSESWNEVNEILSNNILICNIPKYIMLKAISQSTLGKTNEAYQIMKDAQKHYYNVNKDVLSLNEFYPTRETPYLVTYVKSDNSIKKDFYNWLLKLKTKCKENCDTNSVNNINNTIKELKL